MIVEVDGKQIKANLVMFDTFSFQIWGGETGSMIANINADEIEKIILVKKE